MEKTGLNVTLTPPSVLLALAFGSADALQSGRSFCACGICVDEGVGFFSLDLVIWKVVAHQRKPLILCFPASEHLPDGIFFALFASEKALNGHASHILAFPANRPLMVIAAMWSVSLI